MSAYVDANPRKWATIHELHYTWVFPNFFTIKWASIKMPPKNKASRTRGKASINKKEREVMMVCTLIRSIFVRSC